MDTAHRIVILGGGYTGMVAAARLARRTRKQDVRITLVNPSARFTERLRMHQIAAGQELADHRIADILAGTGVEFVQGWATSLDPASGHVLVDGTRTLPYDELIYALGSSTDTDIVPGAADHAWTLNDPRAAHRFAERLNVVAAQGGTVAVCGGGLTGIEAAAEIAENHPELRVTLISNGEPGAMMSEKARAYLNRAFDRLGVVREIGRAVTKVLPGAVELAGGTVVSADLTLWTTGVRVAPLATAAGIATDERGLIVVDETLRSVSHPNIHAVGDAAAIRMPWGQIHGTCQSGVPTAAYTADAIARELRGKAPKPFRFGYFHQPVSLGRRDAIIQFTKSDDTPGRFYLTGRAAVVYKESVSASPVPIVRFSRRMNVPVKLRPGRRADAPAA
ncbi:putative oxidoreductase [Nocardia brasiliensis NBRC 14402]|uniref:NAD(P)/FAD-dependent oxidoreductase n=1 Tax=Nocardia brasiliensis TaxID=37326 RepID=UPI0002DC2991|nr:FAD-dependent oxidoreductase [Nocardia brasiliensis]ASF09144.1 FAD-dependent oxidoreductase [Nocardia brasiliensis]GAJ79336.1 putative oxidoreductase [Nocardia brasiliensis NBRC 14402]SUB40218.1 NADH dehydrogenase [Nocardia brasiliensis]